MIESKVQTFRGRGRLRGLRPMLDPVPERSAKNPSESKRVTPSTGSAQMNDAKAGVAD